MIRRFLYRYLDPLDRLTEIIYGVLIVMTFTMAFRAFEANFLPEAALAKGVNHLFIAAFGCTIAWGFIDGVISVLTSLAERGEKHRMIKAIRRAPDEQTALAAVADELDSTLEPVTDDAERQELYGIVLSRLRDNEPKVEGVKREDIFAAFGLVLLAIVATLPVVIPLLFIQDPFIALRASNLIAIAMLFVSGYLWGRYAGANPIKIGLLTAGIGVALVLVAIPLGG